MDFMINRCLSMVLNELNFTYVDNLIVSFDSEATDSDIDFIWSQVTQEKVRVMSMSVTKYWRRKFLRVPFSTRETLETIKSCEISI